jgi:uncharacterized membrane protein
MKVKGNLWVIAFEDAAHAEAFRGELLSLQTTKVLTLTDMVLVVRNLDGSFVTTRDSFSASGTIFGASLAGFLAGLVLMQPLLGATIGAALGTAGATALSGIGIDDSFIHEAGNLIKPGTAALVLLSNMTDRNVLLHNLRGLGGKVLKTDVDLDSAKQVQAALEAARTAHPNC